MSRSSQFRLGRWPRLRSHCKLGVCIVMFLKDAVVEAPRGSSRGRMARSSWVGLSVREILEGILVMFLLLVEGVGFCAKGTGFILS